MGGCIAFRFQNSPAQDSTLSRTLRSGRRKDPRMLSALPLALLAGTFALTTTAVRSCSTPGHSQLNVRLKTLWSNHIDGLGFSSSDNEFVITLGTGAPKEFQGLASQKTYVRVDNPVHLQRAPSYLCSPFFFALVLRTTRVVSGTQSTLIGRQPVVRPTLQQQLI